MTLVLQYGYHHSLTIQIVEEALQSGVLSVKYVICTVFKKTVPIKQEKYYNPIKITQNHTYRLTVGTE